MTQSGEADTPFSWLHVRRGGVHVPDDSICGPMPEPQSDKKPLEKAGGLPYPVLPENGNEHFHPCSGEPE